MYRLKPGIKRDLVRRWALPDRIFFGYGACAILAGVALKDADFKGFQAEHIIPLGDRSGSHIYATDGTVTFDFRGYALRDRVLAHHVKVWTQFHGASWRGHIHPVRFDLLNRADLNRNKMLGPDQYLGDPVARARAFLRRYDHVSAYARALSTRAGLHPGDAAMRVSEGFGHGAFGGEDDPIPLGDL